MTTLKEAIKAYPQIKGVHPACLAVPEMSGEDWAGLLVSIHKHGLRYEEPIDLTPDGMLLDGRNRLVACVESELPAHFRTINLDPWEYVKVRNIDRRQLTTGQKAMFGQAKFEHEKKDASKRQGTRTDIPALVPEGFDPGDSRDKVASQLGIGGKSLDMAATISRESPDLAAEVLAGRMDLKPAYREAKKRAAAKTANAAPKDEKPFSLSNTAAATSDIVTFDGKAKAIKTPKNVRFNRTNENVDWAGWTWNPVTGCNHGCEFCYARELAHKTDFAPFYPFQFTPCFHEYRLYAPQNTPRPDSEEDRDGRVFVCSMADLFGKWVPDAWITAVFDACLNSPEWQYIFLTKWPARYSKMPLLKNAWYGASIVKQADVSRVEKSMRAFETEGAIKWVSMEPMLGPVVFEDIGWCDLMVIGAQTQTVQPTGEVPAFAPEFDWIVDVVNQCRDANVPYYLKANLGAIAPGMKLPKMRPCEGRKRNKS